MVVSGTVELASAAHFSQLIMFVDQLLAIALGLATFQAAEGKVINQCTQRGMYAMTWDDGPAQYTSQLLETLDAKKVKATFHVTTSYLTDPSIQAMIQRIAGAGHLIGLRTESHWNLFQMSDDQIRAGVARQANVLSSFIGYFPKFIRLPYNGYDQRVLSAIESTGLIVTTHNLETYDYDNDGGRTLTAVKLALSLSGKGQGAFISVQHDGVQQSVGIAGKVIDQIMASGYKLVKLDQCLGLGDMTKNKEPLKGADDSVDLGPLDAGGAQVPGAGIGNAGNVPMGPHDELQGQTKNSGATSLGFPMIAAVLAVALGVVLQF